MKKLKIPLIISFAVILILSITLLIIKLNKNKETTKEYLAFGTYISVTIFNESDNDIFSQIESYIYKMNKLCDKYTNYSDTYGVYYINNHQGEEIVIDSDLYNLIELAINNRVLNSDNTSYFEIGIGMITDLYQDIFDNYNKNVIDSTIFPSDDLINTNYLVDSSLITLNNINHSIIVPVGMKLDLGGCAKGYLLDKIKDMLNNKNCKYIIDCGESSLLTNTINKTKGKEYQVGLINPENTDETYSILKLKENKVLSTSGYYQKYFIYNDKIYSHIINPITNLPADTDILSISIITDSGLVGDILSTTLYLMGSSDAIEYINNHDNIEGIIYLSSGEILKSNNIDSYIVK